MCYYPKSLLYPFLALFYKYITTGTKCSLFIYFLSPFNFFFFFVWIVKVFSSGDNMVPKWCLMVPKSDFFPRVLKILPTSLSCLPDIYKLKSATSFPCNVCDGKLYYAQVVLSSAFLICWKSHRREKIILLNWFLLPLFLCCSLHTWSHPTLCTVCP